MELIRILHCPIGNMNIGGIETMLMQIYRHIDRKKIQFDFVVHDYNENFYEKEILSMGGKIYRIPYISRHPLRHLQEFDLLLKEHPEYKIIHIHTTYSIMYFDALIAKKNGRKVIVHSHNSNATKIHSLLHKCLKARMSRLADYRLSCSNIAGKWMFMPGEYYDIWKNAIDLEKFCFNQVIREKIRTELGLSEDDVLIGNVARLSYQKNQALLLDIYNQYRKINKNSKLILVGDGEDEEYLKAKVESLTLGDSVIFTGSVSNVSDYMMAMDIFCLTSRWEGFGISMIEALAAGATVIAPNWIDDLIKNLNYVYTVGIYTDVDLWVEQLMDCHILSGQDRLLGFQRIREAGYDVKDQGKLVMQYYEKIIAN